MCCSSYRGRRREPAVVALGKMAYDKYQSHKAEKRAIARGNSPDSNYRHISHETLPEAANGEIMEKTGLAPPSYNELVAQRAIVPPTEPFVYVDSKKVNVANPDDERDGLSDAESFYEVFDGMREPNHDMAAAQADFVQKWKARREVKRAEYETEPPTYESKWERKKAARAARRAERDARGGCCC